MAKRREVVVVGAGPAGIAAAIFLRRAGRDPLLLEMGIPGGLLRHAYSVENYPGFPVGMTGPRMADLFSSHLMEVGGVVTKARVTSIKRTEKGFAISSSVGRFLSKAVIVATGTEAKKIVLRGVRGNMGGKVYYSLFDLLASSGTDESIVVYGGGDSAFDQAVNLRHRGYRVTVLCRSKTRCLPLLRKRAEQNNVAIMEGWSIVKVSDSGPTLGLELSDGSSIDAGRLLISCGRRPRLELLDPPLRDQIRRGRPPSTGIPGLYLAGDVVTKGKRQVGIAVGSGISAAMSAERYLQE